MTDGIELQFLSGEHLGAVVNLQIGSYTIGNVEDCDLWLACGGEPCVAQITVHEDGQITVKSLAGQPLYAGQPLDTEEVEFASSKILNIHLNCVAWFKEGEKAENLEATDLGFKGALPQVSQDSAKRSAYAGQAASEDGQTNTSDQPDDVHPGNEQAKDAHPQDNLVENGTAENKQSEEPTENRSTDKMNSRDGEKVVLQNQSNQTAHPRDLQFLYLKIICGLCFLGFLLCLLILGNTWFSRQDPAQIALQNAQEYIKTHNYSGVSVEVKDGLLRYTGTIADRQNYAAFIQNLPQSELSSVIEVQIADAVLRSIERAFALQGLRVRVEFGDNPHELKVHGYVEDAYLAKLAVDKVQPYLGRFNLVPDFTYAPDMEELLFKLNADGKIPLKFSCGRSSVLYQGQMNLEQAQDFEKLREQLELAVKAPVTLESAQRLPETSIVALNQNESNVLAQSGLHGMASDAKASNLRPTGQASDRPIVPNLAVFDANEVVGVTLDPMRFLTLRDGSKYFEGTVLKNGYVLQHISLEQLVFEKNGHQVTVYLQ